MLFESQFNQLSYAIKDILNLYGIRHIGITIFFSSFDDKSNENLNHFR